MTEQLLTGGTVLTMDEHGTEAEAVLVRGNRIAAVGSQAEVAAEAAEQDTGDDAPDEAEEQAPAPH